MSNWNSFSDFIRMNGHGYYVWCAYGAFLAGVLWELRSLAQRRRNICMRLMREARAEQSSRED